jgi:hypothetical protein
MFLVAFISRLAAHIRGVGGSTPPTATNLSWSFTATLGDKSSGALLQLG